MEANLDYDNQHDVDDSQHDSEHDAERDAERDADDRQHDSDDNQHEHDDSDTELLTETHTRSIVWRHFTRDPNFKENKKATCNKCNKSYTCSGGSTSNLLHHLGKKHKLLGTKSQSQELDIRDAFNNSRMKKVMYINFYFIFL